VTLIRSLVWLAPIRIANGEVDASPSRHNPAPGCRTAERAAAFAIVRPETVGGYSPQRRRVIRRVASARPALDVWFEQIAETCGSIRAEVLDVNPQQKNLERLGQVEAYIGHDPKPRGLW
jgi:hypothetical protein